MKRAILIHFLLTFISCISFSQNIYFDSENRQSRIVDFISDSDSTYILAIQHSGIFGFGEIQWIKNEKVEKRVRLTQNILSLKFRRSGNDIFLDLSPIGDCDVFYSSFETINLDSIITESLYSYELREDLFLEYKIYKDSIHIILTGDYFYEYSDVIKVFNDKGELKYSYPVASNLIHKIELLEDRVVFYGEDQISILNPDSGEILSKTLDLGKIRAIRDHYDDNLSILTDNGIHIFDYNLELVFEFLFGIEGIESIDYQLNPYTGFAPNFTVLAKKASEYIHFHSTDTGWMSSSEFLHPNIIYRTVIIDDFGNLYFTGSIDLGLDNPFEYGPAVLQKIEYIVHQGEDIGIEFESYQFSPDSLEMMVNLTNNSDSVLYDIHLYSTPIIGFFCTTFYFDKLIPELNPGNSILVTDKIPIYDFNLDKEICFYTSGQGRIFDPNFGDNISCSTITSLKNAIIKADIEVFPNPAQDFIYLSYSKNNVKFNLFNVSGILIDSGTFNQTINISGLDKGIYFLQVESDNGRITKKVLKK